MKVISIKEPWASLIINGYKEYEFRTWKTKYRGKILIHASKTPDKKALDRFKSLNLNYQYGCIVGEVEIVDCIVINDELNKELLNKNELVYGATLDRTGYAWKLENIEKYSKLIPINGKLGLWEYK